VAVLLFILVYCVSLNSDCQADPKDAVNSAVKQDKVDPADMEVIKNLELLQDWDILGPEGPDMHKMNVLNAKPVKGVSNDK